jgi:hypothetical protein
MLKSYQKSAKISKHISVVDANPDTKKRLDEDQGASCFLAIFLWLQYRRR